MRISDGVQTCALPILQFCKPGRYGLAMLGAIVAPLLLAQPAAAQWPERPIQVIVPFAAGVGLSSALATAVAVASSDAGILPQPFQVVHVPGAGGTLGPPPVQDAAPAGYTIPSSHGSFWRDQPLRIHAFSSRCLQP